jgi:YD repeat-containing protein
MEGANQITTYGYDANNRLNSVTKPNGTVITFTYDANEQRTATTVTPPSGGGSATTVKDYYAQGQLTSQTDGNNNLLATYTYDANGAPASVVVGTDPTGTNSPRYYYIYNAHGDVVNLVDKSGNVVASYAYDTWGNLTSSSENFGSGVTWTNPYRYDGRDGVRYDASDGFYWMQVRAYDPTVGRNALPPQRRLSSSLRRRQSQHPFQLREPGVCRPHLPQLAPGEIPECIEVVIVLLDRLFIPLLSY